MTNNILNSEEKGLFNAILDDLRFIFTKREISWRELKQVLSKLKSEEVKSYIKSLTRGSKPEAALTEALFAGKSILSKYLFKDKLPQVNIGVGFVDYLVEIGNNKFLILELKPPFEGQFELGKGRKRILTKLRLTELTWRDHKEQILRYIREKTDFVVLTNLKDWIFFNKDCSPAHFEPFFKIDLYEFYEEYTVFEDLSKYLEHKDFQSAREDLDKKFFSDLKIWVNQLSNVKFKSGIDERRKSELIIDSINKFIFIQTLDDYGAVDFRWIRTAWEHADRRWGSKGKLPVLKEFFREVKEWFYEYYDTELFREDILDYIEGKDENINSFYETLQQVLGLAYWQIILGFKGIMQYNFRLINEDIFGKAYETYLAEIRKMRGIFYTPQYITEYIVDNTVRIIFDELLSVIKKEINAENFKKAGELINSFISIKVLDPACGSGSFLIKAFRVIWKKYKEITKYLEIKQNEYQEQYKGSLFPPDHLQGKVEPLKRLQEILQVRNDRELVSAIILRHLYGNDLDKKALDVAKVNIWLEGIKRAPKAFRYDTLPRETNHILPDLEINLCNGDSLVGLPENITIKILSEKHVKDIRKLNQLRYKYLDNPTSPSLVQEIEHIKSELRKELDEVYKKYLTENDFALDLITNTKAFHWPLEFWYVFFDEKGKPLKKDRRGFHIIIGNPPYVDYRSVVPIQVHKFFKKAYFSSNVPEKYNLYVLFMEKSISLLALDGKFGYINPVQWMGSLYGQKLREFVFNNYFIREMDDLSVIGVFDEPTLTNLGLFFFDNVKSRTIIRIGYKVTKDDIIKRNINFRQVKKDDLVFGRDRVFLFDPNIKVKSILTKLISKKYFLSDIVDLEWGTSKSGYGKEKIKFESYRELSPLQKDDYAPIVQTGDIGRHIIIWQGEFIAKSIFPTIKQRQFKKNKIVFTRRSSLLKCAYDNKEFFLGKVAFTSKFKQKIDPLLLLGILNSNLLNFFFVKVYETLHPGGNLRIDIPYINNLPVNTQESEEIAHLVSKIITLKKLQYMFKDIWCYYSKKYRNDYWSLGKILLRDKRILQQGNFDEVWISEASVYPDEENELLEKQFRTFRVVGDGEKKLYFYGILGSKEKELLRIETKNKDIRDIIYLEISELLDSRTKVRMLKDIFLKSTISVIQPNIWKKSGNLIKGTVKKFEESIKKEDLNIKEKDIVKISNEIKDTDSQIDALVFKLYKLTEDETKIVLDSLKIPISYQQRVFKHYKIYCKEI